jgi:hypothetical protein
MEAFVIIANVTIVIGMVYAILEIYSHKVVGFRLKKSWKK